MHPGDTKMCQYSLCSSDSACSQTSVEVYFYLGPLGITLGISRGVSDGDLLQLVDGT